MMSAAASTLLLLAEPRAPYELVIRGSENAVAFACHDCGAVYTTYMFGDGQAGEVAAKHLALEHCRRLCACGAPMGKGRTRCNDCWEKNLAEKEALVFQKAKKVTIEQYPDKPLYWDGGFSDGYFLSLEELLDRCEEENLEVPLYAWGTKEVPFTMDASWLLERALEDHGEGAREEIEDAADLQGVLDAWCKKQDLKSWVADYSLAVLLHPQE